MENIDTKQFIDQWLKIEAKLKEISLIPKHDGNGENFVGIEIDDNVICYKTENPSLESGCYYKDTYCFYVDLSQINQPIEYFKDIYSKEIEDEKRKLELKKQNKEKEMEEREYQQFQQLKNKYGKN